LFQSEPDSLVIQIGIRENGGPYLNLLGNALLTYSHNLNNFELTAGNATISGTIETNQEPHTVKIDIQTKTSIVIEIVGMENAELDDRKLIENRISLEPGKYHKEISGVFTQWHDWD